MQGSSSFSQPQAASWTLVGVTSFTLFDKCLVSPVSVLLIIHILATVCAQFFSLLVLS